MNEQVTAVSNAYLDFASKIGALYWGSSQRLARLQTEAGVRLFTESADGLKDILSKRDGGRSIPDWNSLYLSSTNKVFDIARNYLDEVSKVRIEVAQVMDDYTSIVAKKARENAENHSAIDDAIEKSSARMRSKTT